MGDESARRGGYVRARNLFRRGVRVLAVAAVIAAIAGCGANKTMSSARMPVAPAAAPPALDRSVFSADPNGKLTEDNLQKILAAPIELSLPARVGVLPIMEATDWRGPGPDHRVPAGVSELVKRLRQDAAFTLVTETMVIPSGALGMEALREIAARYRLRYLLLYREVLSTDSRLNAWAFGYATVIGALFLPGKRHEVHGFSEATMFDVKTGTLMFTARRAIHATERGNQWHQQHKRARLAAAAAIRFAPDLAADVLFDLRRYERSAELENARKRGQVPDEVVSIPTGAAIATEPPR